MRGLLAPRTTPGFPSGSADARARVARTGAIICVSLRWRTLEGCREGGRAGLSGPRLWPPIEPPSQEPRVFLTPSRCDISASDANASAMALLTLGLALTLVVQRSAGLDPAHSARRVATRERGDAFENGAAAVSVEVRTAERPASRRLADECGDPCVVAVDDLTGATPRAITGARALPVRSTRLRRVAAIGTSARALSRPQAYRRR